jgi:hypothetical protein
MKFNALLWVFMAITITGIVARLLGESSLLWEVYGTLDTASAVALATLAFLGYMEYTRLEDKIKVCFDVDGEKIDTGLSLLRKNCTRSEIFGLLGMIQKDTKKRFEVAFMKDLSLLDSLQKIQKGKDNSFIIPLSKKELAQFTLPQETKK